MNIENSIPYLHRPMDGYLAIRNDKVVMWVPTYNMLEVQLRCAAPVSHHRGELAMRVVTKAPRLLAVSCKREG